MRILIALGGNALLRRSQPLTAENQLDNIRRAAQQLARVAPGNELVITHGNGPQVGLLAMQAAAGDALCPMPLDVLDAESEGMIGYLLEQELTNALCGQRVIATLLTRVEVDANDPAFAHPTKPVGPVYGETEARQLAAARNWSIARDGDGYRRVVASPKPVRIVEPAPIEWLLERGAVVIAAGGGGIPVARSGDDARYDGVEAVIDKDRCSGLLAAQLQTDLLVIATDVDGVYTDWGTPAARRVTSIEAARLAKMGPFPAGSMAPKVEAACAFVQATGCRAVIGSLDDIGGLIAGDAGTQITGQHSSSRPA